MYKVIIARQSGQQPEYISFYCESYALLDIAAMTEMLNYLGVERRMIKELDI